MIKQPQRLPLMFKLACELKTFTLYQVFWGVQHNNHILVREYRRQECLHSYPPDFLNFLFAAKQGMKLPRFGE